MMISVIVNIASRRTVLIMILVVTLLVIGLMIVIFISLYFDRNVDVRCDEVTCLLEPSY